VIASLGVYGVVSYIVEQRRREFGIRLALGARRNELVHLGIRQGVGPSVCGIVRGIGGAMLIGRLNSTLFAGAVSGSNVPMLLSVAALLCILALVASYGPASRIANEDAALTLKIE
jgi:ABC-type antimicrobial peptide transport system permease subunit